MTLTPPDPLTPKTEANTVKNTAACSSLSLTSPKRVQLILMRLIALLAMLTSGYLLYHSLRGGEMLGCTGKSNCDQVLASQWATWLGIPTSAIALASYGVMLISTFFLSQKQTLKTKRIAWWLLQTFSLIAAFSALWFTSIQAWKLDQFCPWCMTTHTLSILMAMAVWTARQKLTSFKILTSIVAAATVAMAVLISVQTYYPDATMKAAQFGGIGDFDTGPGAKRQLAVLNGKLRFNPHDYPIIGSPDAKHILLYLFDYTCPHCRAQHKNLEQVLAYFKGEIAIVCLPMPLDAKCNPLVKKTHKRHRNACKMGTLAMSVWKASPDQFVRFHQWMMATKRPPKIKAIKRYIKQTLKIDLKNNLQATKWAANQLKINVKVYEISGGGVIPIILAPNLVMTGRAATAQEVIDVLNEEFYPNKK